MRSFGSDNHSGVHRDILSAISEANKDHVIAYGDDPYTEKVSQKIKQLFGEQAHFFPMFNGTGANICALRACLQPYHAIIAPETGHIFVDECGAPEWLTGAAVKSVSTPDGKVRPEMLHPFFHHFGFEHHSQPKVLYISQLSELGTAYTIAEIKALADLLHQHNMYLHMDGARIANAAATLGVSFKEITTDAGVDILSFGGTKNGMMLGESVITFRPELAENMKYIRKQSTQLYSKMRFCSAQFLAYLENDLWLQNARHANKMAQMLRSELEKVSSIQFTQPTDGNILLLKMEPDMIEKLLQKHFFYIWDEMTHEIRLVTSWDTTEEDVQALISDVKNI
ncbi:MAG TPA: aminotransferase class I/II-fold pyridoxal phosphate-dependent enzyme [Bacteroidales bacterium]|jgi:threonine aldolase|nr:aminotransferase class I/II-fold pyridoxal phosphate-dependent enzyme [Bacteroidales bacterium]HPE39545.1 aminotransferase class I/II-fold pyridoxal phosphate-dependent enzyme [Bacteroidales bacterium]